MAEALRYIGVARMAGGIETGEENARALVRAGKAKLLLLAADASPGAKRRAEGYVYETKVPLVQTPYQKSEISAISGRPGCSMAAFTNLGLAAGFAEALCAEFGEQYRALAEALGARQERAKRRAKESGKRRKNA